MRHYIVSPDRCLIHTQSPLIEGWEVCQDLKTLMAFTKNSPSKQQEEMKWIGPKIPANIWENVFGTMAKFPNMEIHLNIYHKITTGEWAIKCPKQRGSGASVSSEDNLDGMPKGYHMIGTIHSHPNMSAFWSGTDMNDQQRKYGLHFVFGLTKGLPTSYKCSIFTPRTHFDQEWTDVCEEIDFKKTYEPVTEWVETIKKQELKPATPAWSYHGNSYTQHHPTYSFGGDIDSGWGDDVGWADPYYKKNKKVQQTPKPESPVNWATLQKIRQRERVICTDEANSSMEEILRAAVEFLSNNAAVDIIASVLEDYDLKLVDKQDEDRDYAEEVQELLESFSENGYPEAEQVNEVLENFGYKLTEEAKEEQFFYSEAALDAYAEQEAIKEMNKC